LECAVCTFTHDLLLLTQEEGWWQQVLAAIRVVAAMDFSVAVQATTRLLNVGIGFG
jgi:hypothetical protein